MKKILLGTIIILSLFVNLYSYNQLQILDPQSWWSSSQGTIEEALITVRPQGIYVEYSMYLTFSARGNYNGWGHQDTLEVVLDFDLPQEAVVHDLWLWVHDDIMRAQIMDVWSASAIYEDIVDRRKDPAILYKKQGYSNYYPYEYEGYYELRVFPMAGDETRKVKLSFMLPADWMTDKISSSIPMNILQTSMNSVGNCKILFFPDEEWYNPRLNEHPEIEFLELNDPQVGQYFQADIQSIAMNGDLTLSFDSPMKNGFYFNCLNNGKRSPDADGDDNFYQFAFYPSEFLNVQSNQNLLLVIGYDVFNTSYQLDNIITNIKSAAMSYLDAADSINIVFSGINTDMISDNWVSASPENLNQLFNNLSSAEWRSYCNLPSLLSTAVNFLNNKGKNGKILLMSSSDNEGNYDVANSIIHDLRLQMDQNYPINVVDFCNENYNSYWINNQYYYGNDYLYINLTRITEGEYFNIRNDPSLDKLIANAFSVMEGFISSFDVYTGMTNGFCYNRYSSCEEGRIYLRTPVWQIGKYVGDFPFKMNFNGIFNSQTFSVNKEISVDQTALSDTLVAEVWASKHLLDLESQTQTNEVVNEIVNYSVKERVLSLYTAFLSLEPNDTLHPCIDCFDEWDLSDVEDSTAQNEELADTLLAQAYPNPFNAEVTISVTIPQVNVNDNIAFKIYDILGQEVKSFNDVVTAGKTRYGFVWNGKNNYGESVSSGIYFFVTKTGKEVKTIKLMMMK
ncbi:MAG: T9SS type A sorting domain-containing protein [bacterium]